MGRTRQMVSKKGSRRNGYDATTPLPPRMMAFVKAFKASNRKALDDLHYRLQQALADRPDQELKSGGAQLRDMRARDVDSSLNDVRFCFDVPTTPTTLAAVVTRS